MSILQSSPPIPKTPSPATRPYTRAHNDLYDKIKPGLYYKVDRSVLDALIRLLEGFHQSWVAITVPQLASKAGVSMSSTTRALARLEEAAILHRRRKKLTQAGRYIWELSLTDSYRVVAGLGPATTPMSPSHVTVPCHQDMPTKETCKDLDLHHATPADDAFTEIFEPDEESLWLARLSEADTPPEPRPQLLSADVRDSVHASGRESTFAIETQSPPQMEPSEGSNDPIFSAPANEVKPPQPQTPKLPLTQAESLIDLSLTKVNRECQAGLVSAASAAPGQERGGDQPAYLDSTRQTLTPEQAQSFDCLRSVGIDLWKARQLARSQPLPLIKQAVERLKYRAGSVRNPAAWIVREIERGGYAPPPALVSEEKRQAEQAAKDLKKRLEEQHLAEVTRTQEQKTARLLNLFHALPQERQTQLEDQVRQDLAKVSRKLAGAPLNLDTDGPLRSHLLAQLEQLEPRLTGPTPRAGGWERRRTHETQSPAQVAESDAGT